MASFTDEVKHELIHNKEFKLADLVALIRMNGSVQIKEKHLSVKINIRYGELARKIYSLIKKRFNLNIEIIVRQNNNFNGYNTYELILTPQKGIKQFLIKLGFLDENNNISRKIKTEFIDDRESKKSYLRGVFLAGGSVNKPRGEYHLEIRCDYEKHAREIVKLLLDFDLKAHLRTNKSRHVIYFKKFAEITTFLNIIGAYNSQLKMESIHTLKDVKNNINRRVNAETANLDKTVKAAMKQLEDISLLEENGEVGNLSQGLKEIIQLRKENPYASLKELGQMLKPSLTKSGINHRFRRLHKIADKYRKKNDHKN